MKKLLLIFILCMVSNIYATDFNVNGINYTGTDAAPYTATLANNASFVGAATIPSTVEYDGITYSVTAIGEYTFFECTGLTSVTIPDSVIAIDEGAFFVCNNLTSINIPDSVIAIGESAFSNCISLTSINIPDSVIAIGASAFLGCTGFTSINIPDSVTTISENVFRNCTSLTSINIPDSVTTIGTSAFYNCESLTSINIPDSITTIGDYAFFNNALTSVISESLNPATLPSTIFDDHSSIDLTIPEGTTQAYVTAGWTGFNSVTEVTTLNTNENTILENLSFTSNANTIVITTTNGIRLERISLYNMSGQRVLISKQTEVSINHLASGVYIAQLTTNLGTVAKKFAK